jgi:hypothetical protein
MRKLVRMAKVASAAALILLALSPAARGEEAWRENFEKTCSKTSEAMTLSVAELNALLDRCAALEKVIGAQEESVRKVYLKRLTLCKNLYVYMLEYKKTAQAAQ